MSDQTIPPFTTLSDPESNVTTGTPMHHAPYGQIERRHVVVNYMDNDIVVQFREGIPLLVRPQAGHPKNTRSGILVRLIYTLGKHVDILGYNVTNAPTSELYDDVKTLQQAIRTAYTTGDTQQNKVFEIDYFIPTNRLREAGGNVYIQQLDILFSTNSTNGVVGVHPHSRQAMHLKHKHQDTVETQNSFYYRLRFVDNERIYKSKYLNLNGVVYAIHPTTDPESKCGIYFYIPKASKFNNPHEPGVLSEYYPIEEAFEKFHMYDTYEEALSHGNQKEAYEQELEKTKRDLKERGLELESIKQERANEYASLKADLETEALKIKAQYEEEAAHAKRFYERELEERQVRMDRLKEDREYFKDMLESRQMYRKDHYDERSHVRKDTSEFIKAIPVVLTAAATAIGFFIGGRMK